ncbi:MAG: C39 family peptidase [Candidatus Woesearchaeota archaeon]
MKLDIRPIKQTKGLCGASSMKMVMDYYDIVHSEEYWAKLTAVQVENGKVNRLYGCSEEKILKVAKSFGFKGLLKENSSIKELREYIDRKIPVIVDWFSPEEGPHFSVVAGFEKDKIILADPHFGEFKKHKIEWFEERWFDVPYPSKTVNDLILRAIIVWYKP